MNYTFIRAIALLLLIPALAFGAAEEYPVGSGNWYPGSYASQSLAESDIEDAITAATEGTTSFLDGDTVHLKAGSATWTATVGLDKKISIVGAGIGNTIITRSSGQFFSITDSARLSGVQMEWITPAASSAAVRINAQNFRFDNNRIDNHTTTSTYGILLRYSSYDPYPTGVIDSSEFQNCRITPQNALTSPYLTKWSDELSVSPLAETIFVEDNIFDHEERSSAARNIIDNGISSRITVRYNLAKAGALETHGAYEQTYPRRGSRWWECYGNTITNDPQGEAPASVIWTRSGTGIIWGNTWDLAGPWGNPYIKMDSNEKRRGACTGSAIADENTSGGAGYLCRDGIGAFQDEFTWVENGAIPDQEHIPYYVWDNESDNVVVVNGDDAAHVWQDRDWFSTTNNGLRKGTWANRPATCTYRQGYWATDRGGNWHTTNATTENDGALYLCNDSNEWGDEDGTAGEIYYVPYTYPHPLREGTATEDTTPPTVESASVSGGTSVTVNLSETVDPSGYVNGDFYANCTTAGNGISLNSISGTNPLTLTAATSISAGDTCTINYSGRTNGIEDLSGNDLAAFTGTTLSVVESDTTPPEVSTLLVLEDRLTVEMTLTEDVTFSGLAVGDFSLNCSTSGTLNLGSMTGPYPGDWREFTLSGAIDVGDTCTLEYVGGEGKCTDAAGNSMIAFTGFAIDYLGTTEDTTPPVISSPSPSGTLACSADPRTVTLSVATDEYATCKYDTSTLSYDSMANTFAATEGTTHSSNISVVCGTAKTYYVRCVDSYGNANTSSTQIAFNVASGATVGYNKTYDANSAPISYDANAAPITLQ